MHNSNLMIKAKQLINRYPIFYELPASISGNFHLGETLAGHSKRVVEIANSLCDAYKIKGRDRSIVCVAALLHDIGNCEISLKGKAANDKYTYFDKTGYSRLNHLHKLHPLISKYIILNAPEFNGFEEERKMIANIVASHMNKWYDDTPRPQNIYEHIVAISDFLSSRKELFNNVS